MNPMLEAQQYPLWYIYSSYPLQANSVEAVAHCALQTVPPPEPSTSRPSLVPQLFQSQDVLPTVAHCGLGSELKKRLRTNSARENFAHENSSCQELNLVQQDSTEREAPPSARRNSLRPGPSLRDDLGNSGREEAAVTAERTEAVAVTSGRGKQKTDKIGLPLPNQLPPVSAPQVSGRTDSHTIPRECSGPGVDQHRQARLARPVVHI